MTRCLRLGVLVVVLLQLGCTSESRAEPVAGDPEVVADVIPVRAGVTHGPGTTLGHGFEVDEGSLLVGAVLRRLNTNAATGEVPDEGWTALLLVTVPGRAVFDRYVKQAEEAGFSAAGSVAYPRGDRICLGVGAELSCGVIFREGTEDRHRDVRIFLDQHAGTHDRPTESSLVIEYFQVGEPPFEPWVADGPVPKEGGGVGEVPQDGWSALPEVDGAFWTAKPSGSFRVVEGTTMLMPSVTYDSVGSLTLFEVTDDPDKVLERYFDQSQKGNEVPEIQHWERDGATVDSMSWSDGGGYTLRVFGEKHQPTWLLIEAWPSD